MNEQNNSFGTLPNPSSWQPSQQSSPQEAMKEVQLQPQSGLKGIVGNLMGLKIARSIFLGVGLFVLLVIFAVFVFRNLRTVGLGGELLWWGVTHEAGVYAPLIAEFEKLNPNIRIKYEKQSPQDYQERLISALNLGKGPDIFEVHNSWPASILTLLSRAPSSLFTQEDYKAAFYPIINTNFNLNGGIVAVPLEFDALTLYLNEDIFAASAKVPPSSWDDIRSLSTSLTQKDARGVIVQSGAALGTTNNVDYWPDIIGLMLLQNKVSPVKPTGSFAADVIDYYTLFNKRSWDETQPPSTEAFAKGKVAMYFGPTREAVNIIRQNPSIRFRTVQLPQLPKNSPQDPDFAYATYWAHSVSAKSKSDTLAWEFLKFMASPESLSKINSNIETLETFPRIFPRPEMNTPKREDPLLGSVIVLSGEAGSSFLADKTFDRPNGVNAKINSLYRSVISRWSARSGESLLLSLSGEIVQTLSLFGITIR